MSEYQKAKYYYNKLKKTDTSRLNIEEIIAFTFAKAEAAAIFYKLKSERAYNKSIRKMLKSK